MADGILNAATILACHENDEGGDTCGLENYLTEEEALKQWEEAMCEPVSSPYYAAIDISENTQDLDVEESQHLIMQGENGLPDLECYV